MNLSSGGGDLVAVAIFAALVVATLALVRACTAVVGDESVTEDRP